MTETIRALVLTGKDPAFCAGGDISAMQQRMGCAPPASWRQAAGFVSGGCTA